MRGITLGVTAMLLLAAGHELNAQSVAPDRAVRQGRMEMHERRQLRRDRHEIRMGRISCAGPS